MTAETTSQKRIGFVVLVGRSNVGKSTLLNNLVGTKIAITSPKPQTTRRAIQGVVHAPEGQIIFIDTPGVFQKSADQVTAKLNQAVKNSLKGVDLLLYVVDPTRAIGPEEENVMRMAKGSEIPIILVINKIDERPIPFVEDYRALSPDFAATVEISALRRTHLKTLITEIFARLPFGEPVYPEHQITNVENREWYAEIIREKIFLLLRQELPYSASVEVDEIENRTDKRGGELLYIRARILTDSDRHKKMLIGAGGRRVKQIGMMTRRELEQVAAKKVFLDLEVGVDPHWPERL
jgi:GTP-binding protein Era